METTATAARTAIIDRKGVERYRKGMLNWLTFKVAMAYALPMGVISGMRITKIDDESCEVTVPYKFLNKNPFKTTYWAVLGMAAEMAGGAILLTYVRNCKPSIATFVVGCESKFVNRALGVSTFVCEDVQLFKNKIEEAVALDEPLTFDSTSIGYAKDGTVVSEFSFTWSIKPRKK